MVLLEVLHFSYCFKCLILTLILITTVILHIKFILYSHDLLSMDLVVVMS